MAPTQPIQVAVVGGGCAGLTAAFELTRPEHRGKYRVTVYQVGWRLGGKGASGRGPADRIEEHGLHLWMGFYENAFRLMRECYAEAARDPRVCRISGWRDAFVPDHFNALADRSPNGAWLPWAVALPPLPGLPGDPADSIRPQTIGHYVSSTLTLLRTLLDAIQVRVADRGSPSAGGASRSTGGLGAALPSTPAALTETILQILRLGQVGTFGAVSEALRILEAAVAATPGVSSDLLLRFQETISAATRSQFEALVVRDDALRRLWEIFDLTLAVVRGVIRFQLVVDPRGFDAIDDYDCREWLRLNGASERAINSAFVRALYDLAFAYEDGDVRRPRIAAGQALRGAVRAFFTYRGAFFWKMQAGMGDVVFAPLWEVLKRRGVQFEFFHRLEKLRLSGDSRVEAPHVEALEFDVQATTVEDDEYRPLVDVRGLPCWPCAPDFTQLRDGATMQSEGWSFESHWDRRHVAKKTLRVGADFDFVVLAVGLGAVPHVCGDILARDSRWRTMIERVKSVPTQAFQIWMTDDMKALGWEHGPVNLSGFVEPFDTWADMSHLAAEESFCGRVRAIAYFCSVLPDGAPGAEQSPDYPVERREEARRNAIAFLDQEIGHLWPKAVNGRAGFRWETLVGPGKGTDTGWPDQRAFDTQYWRANVDPSDRYVLSLPGSLRHRISPLDRTYDNLTVAGDWTDCGFNEGCVEAAVMSGRLAAHALSKSPPLEEIVGFDHP